MTDPRKKNTNWRIGEPEGRNGYFSHDQAQLAVLMDIRDELQSLNALLHCTNFTGIPQTLRGIRKNTTKPRKPKG